MNKKILLVSILSFLMLLTISFASAINTNTTDSEKKESPLYGIRTRQAIKETLTRIIENIKTKFIGNRLFFLPFTWILNSEDVPIFTQVKDGCPATIQKINCPTNNPKSPDCLTKAPTVYPEWCC